VLTDCSKSSILFSTVRRVIVGSLFAPIALSTLRVPYQPDTSVVRRSLAQLASDVSVGFSRTLGFVFSPSPETCTDSVQSLRLTQPAHYLALSVLLSVIPR